MNKNILTVIGSLVTDYINGQKSTFNNVLCRDEAKANLLSGAKLYTYVPGTEAPLNLCLPDGVTVYPSPVYFDSHGNPPEFASASNVKVVIRDIYGTTLCVGESVDFGW